jgi:hypothetical protein
MGLRGFGISCMRMVAVMSGRALRRATHQPWMEARGRRDRGRDSSRGRGGHAGPGPGGAAAVEPRALRYNAGRVRGWTCLQRKAMGMRFITVMRLLWDRPRRTLLEIWCLPPAPAWFISIMNE